jgi:hypothetical protein
MWLLEEGEERMRRVRSEKVFGQAWVAQPTAREAVWEADLVEP